MYADAVLLAKRFDRDLPELFLKLARSSGVDGAAAQRHWDGAAAGKLEAYQTFIGSLAGKTITGGHKLELTSHLKEIRAAVEAAVARAKISRPSASSLNALVEGHAKNMAHHLT